jgi:oxygen-independent coproporphyrinogen III oxidase
MAGIYIHIPFCRKKCFYCDFYKSTRLKEKDLFLSALHREMELQHSYLQKETIETLYLGGGTPSVLSHGEIAMLINWLSQIFIFNPSAEITLEANPDDLNPDYLSWLLQSGINRISIGIQSFSDQDLQKMNRRHTALQAEKSVYSAYMAGFSDISIDLIYGVPGMSLPQWIRNLQISVQLPVTHISAYHLTYHEGTPFHSWLKKGSLTEITEDESIAQFDQLINITEAAGFEQYEISNFARNQAYSRHNRSYWQREKYLGLGPSAHSFDRFSRQWNVSDLNKYIVSIQSGIIPFEKEILTETDKLNDYLITGIRTKWGISPEYIRRVFGEVQYRKTDQVIDFYIKNNSLKRVGDRIVLTNKGIMISDQIMLALLAE